MKAKFRSTKMVTGLFALTSIIGCSQSLDGAPKGAIEAAYKGVNEYCSEVSIECADLSVGHTRNEEVSDADKRNGVNKKYEIKVDYSFKNRSDGIWYPVNECYKLVEKTDGSWDIIREGKVYRDTGERCMYM